MKCADALILLLDADLAAPSADDASLLGAHVQDCARCRAVAVALQADTSRLATLAVAHPAPTVRATRTNRRAIWAAPIPLAAAAVLAYIVLSRVPPYAAPPVTTSTQVAAASHPATATDLAIVAPAPRIAARIAARIANRNAVAATQHHAPEDAAAALESRRSAPRRIDVGGPTLARPVAPTPVTYAADFTGAEMASVDVSTAGGRVVVLRPSNSNITVVWFY